MVSDDDAVTGETDDRTQASTPFQAASEALWSVMQESLGRASATDAVDLQGELQRRFTEIAEQCWLGFTGATGGGASDSGENASTAQTQEFQDLSQLAAAAGASWVMGSARYGQALASNYASYLQSASPLLGSLYSGSEEEQSDARRQLVEQTRTHLRVTAELVSREARQFEQEVQSMSQQLRRFAQAEDEPAEKPRRYARAKA